MDFSLPDSDCWDSNQVQDDFIEKYCNKRANQMKDVKEKKKIKSCPKKSNSIGNTTCISKKRKIEEFNSTENSYVKKTESHEQDEKSAVNNKSNKFIAEVWKHREIQEKSLKNAHLQLEDRYDKAEITHKKKMKYLLNLQHLSQRAELKAQVVNDVISSNQVKALDRDRTSKIKRKKQRDGEEKTTDGMSKKMRLSSNNLLSCDKSCNESISKFSEKDGKKKLKHKKAKKTSIVVNAKNDLELESDQSSYVAISEDKFPHSDKDNQIKALDRNRTNKMKREKQCDTSAFGQVKTDGMLKEQYLTSNDLLSCDKSCNEAMSKSSQKFDKKKLESKKAMEKCIVSDAEDDSELESDQSCDVKVFEDEFSHSDNDTDKDLEIEVRNTKEFEDLAIFLEGQRKKNKEKHVCEDIEEANTEEFKDAIILEGKEKQICEDVEEVNTKEFEDAIILKGKRRKNKKKRNQEIIKEANHEESKEFQNKEISRKKDVASEEKNLCYSDVNTIITKNCDKLSLNKNNKSQALKSKAQKCLQAAKFRLLNEKLYSVSGRDASNYFKNNVADFEDYHEGYRAQVMKWPINPVDVIIKNLYKKDTHLVIADMGCGEAKIAANFPHRKIHSFDLVALNELVTCCDFSKVNLPSESVDIAVFCLSLMGTNLKDYIHEAHRILKLGGELKIAEVESRIEDLNQFIKSIEVLGFDLVNKDIAHKMFVFLDFNKVKKKLKKSNVPSIYLKACLYKKR